MARNTTTRRGALGAVAALSAGLVVGRGFAPAPVVAATEALSPAAAIAARGPDAAFIRDCDAYMAAVRAYNADGGDIDCEDDPLWHAAEAALAKVEDYQPRTMAGVAAKARVARFLAQQPGGGEEWGDSYTGDWPAQIAQDVLRLVGEGAA